MPDNQQPQLDENTAQLLQEVVRVTYTLQPIVSA